MNKGMAQVEYSMYFPFGTRCIARECYKFIILSNLYRRLELTKLDMDYPRYVFVRALIDTETLLRDRYKFELVQNVFHSLNPPLCMPLSAIIRPAEFGVKNTYLTFILRET